MKRWIMVIALMLCICSYEAQAQRVLKGMRALELRAGMVDGIYSHDTHDAGFSFGIAMSRYANNANKWVFGAEYLRRNYPYEATHVPMAQFTAEGGYCYKFLSDASKTLFCYVGGSAVAGYETVNWGDNLLYDGARLQNRDRALYGGAATLQLEAYLCERIVMSIYARERVLWGTTTGHFYTQYGLSLSFIID